jgi:L-cystine uptake protein TcyP (sodium:dicarboxylate symporter family)
MSSATSSIVLLLGVNTSRASLRATIRATIGDAGCSAIVGEDHPEYQYHN